MASNTFPVPPLTAAATTTAAAQRAPCRWLAAWLVAAALLALLVPVQRAVHLAEGEAARLAGRSSELSATAAALGVDSPTLAGLREELAGAQATAQAFSGLRQELDGRQVAWSEVLTAVGGALPEGLRITSLTQDGRLLTLEGLATSDQAVVAYVDRLETSGVFQRVSVQVIEAVGSTPAGTASSGAVRSTPTPSAPVASAEPAAGDAYEGEDAAGSLLVPGAPHRRTFHVAGDVDRARFIAKAGRTYRVSTSDLTPNVDTVVTVRVGGATVSNDDERPGVLSSSVLVTVPAGADLNGAIEVYNRGIAGPGQAYVLHLEEVVPTPSPTAGASPTVGASPTSAQTPTPSVTPSATPTATPSPTATATATTTATVVPGDAYEPDEESAPVIWLGKAQQHTFHREGDVDRVAFWGEPGRQYRVTTFNLGPGVDTHLVVRANGALYANDDRAAGDPASQVLFPGGALQVEQALIEVSNKGQYGAAQGYMLLVEEVVSVPASSSLPAVPAGGGRAYAPHVAARGPAAARLAPASRAGVRGAPLEDARVRFALLLELRTP